MKKPILLIFLLIGLVVVLSVIRTFVANNVATSGVILSEIELKAEKLETENTIVAQKLHTSTSLTEISQKAQKLGFTEGKGSFAITGVRPVAFKQ